MATKKISLQTAYVQRAVDMDEQPYYSTTTTYIEAGALTTGQPAKAAMYFGDLSGLRIKSLSLHICRQDTYNAHVLTVSAATAYSSDGTSLGTYTFAKGDGVWTAVDLTAHIETIKSAPYIRLTHGSGSSWSSFYKTGANAPYLQAVTEGGLVYYCADGTTWKPCEAYYCADGANWTQCDVYYCEDGTTWKECGE